jgi:uncharacterized protein YjiS (DUF1127 family)
MHNSLVIAADEAPRSVSARLASFTKVVGTRFTAAYATYLQRRELRDLDARMLADIGLTVDDVKRETSRSFWDGR